MLSGFGQTAVTLCCMTIALLIIAFCYFGSYTKKVHLQGVIVPSTGLISVRTNYQGSIQTLNVQEGQHVQQGTELFTISNDTYDKKGASIYNSLKSSLEQQYSSLLGQKDYEALIVNSRTSELQSTIARLNMEIQGAKQSLSLAQQLTTIKQQAQLSYQKLRDKNYISEITFKDYQSSLVRLQAEEQSKIMLIQQLEREQINTQHQLDHVQLQGNTRALEINRQLDNVKQQQIELLSNVETTQLSPVDGEIATLRVESGQTVGREELVLNIIPAHASLQLELYAPNRAIGFIKEGQNVGLRFDAFPYEKFGVQEGTVISISQSTLSPQELKSRDQTIRNDTETLYRIIVQLKKPTINIYGSEYEYRVGMSAIADIQVETRQLYEWLLGPVTRIQGKLE